MYDRKKIHSAQNVTDVSFFCSDAWRYVDRVHASSKEEYLLAPDHHTGEIALARRQAANQHLASCEAEEEALCRRAGKRPRTRALVARRKRSCERRGF